MNGPFLLAGLACIWALVGWILGLSGVALACAVGVGCTTGILSFMFGVQAADEPLVVNHGEEAALTALRALTTMENRYSICPYCHKHTGHHAESCALRIAKESLYSSG